MATMSLSGMRRNRLNVYHSSKRSIMKQIESLIYALGIQISNHAIVFIIDHSVSVVIQRR